MKSLISRILFTAIISFISNNIFCQQLELEKELPIGESFLSTVTEGMNKHNKNPGRSSFWENNVMRQPLYTSNDSIVYNVKFITHYNGLLLWSGMATFINNGDSVNCRISDLIQLKKSGFGQGITYINVKVKDMEGTKGDELNLHRIGDEINKFYKKFK